MRIVSVSILLGLLCFTASAQPGSTKKSSQHKRPTANTSSAKKPARSKPVQLPEQLDDKGEFEKASAIEDLAVKAEALNAFLTRFPTSELVPQARELLSSTAYGAAEELLVSKEIARAVELFRLAADAAPKPVPAKLFSESLIKIPNVLFWGGHRKDAIDVAKVLESKIEGNAAQLADLAMFYAGIESGDDAVGLAELAIKFDPALPRAYEVLGLAQRVSFRLDESAAAYAKALELDPSSVGVKRSLADIKRALGNGGEALALYREVMAANTADMQARNGMVLALFDSGKSEEAEKELVKALQDNPRNVMLIAGVAYWYAANKKSERAVDLAQRAIAIEPRYIWSHIALARGLMQQNKALEAEEVLLKARSYGNFATLEYELASARFMAGFYRDAVEGLQNSFSIADGSIKGLIGARVERKGTSFSEIIADERRASIFAPNAPDDTETAVRLQRLMALSGALRADNPDASAIAKAADDFVAGDEKFKVHRQLYAASVLLGKGVAVDKALELAKAAVGQIDAALAVPNAGAAVMASELYESRKTALGRNELLRVPDVPKQTLSGIVRGRIEELIGWALLQQNQPAEATIHFKRAVSILPDKSAWWRAGMWRLGMALQADGKDQEALDTYIKSYSTDKPDVVKYTVVEQLYRKLNGTDEGLAARIGPNPMPLPVATENIVRQAPSAETAPASRTDATPTDPSADASLTPASSSPSPTPENAASPSPIRSVTNEPGRVSEITPSPLPTVSVEPTPTSSPSVEALNAQPSPLPTSKATMTPEPSPVQQPEVPQRQAAEEKNRAVNEKPTPAETLPGPTPAVQPGVTPTPLASLSPTPETVPTPEAMPTSTPDLSPSREPKIEPAVMTTSQPSPAPSPTPKDATVAKIITAETSTGKAPTRERSPKPLFEPIIITIPKPEEPKSSAAARTFDGRPRLIDGQPVQTIEHPPCVITVNQERLSLINNGGTVSVLVGVDKAGVLSDIKFVISSPSDISITLDSEVELIQGRALYIIRSISDKTGQFRITFYLPCGKKDVAVTVR